MTGELIRSKAAQSLLTYDFGNSFTTISPQKGCHFFINNALFYTFRSKVSKFWILKFQLDDT